MSATLNQVDRVPVYLELGAKRVFASARDWHVLDHAWEIEDRSSQGCVEGAE